jgi:hypothetical protein
MPYTRVLSDSLVKDGNEARQDIHCGKSNQTKKAGRPIAFTCSKSKDNIYPSLETPGIGAG